MTLDLMLLIIAVGLIFLSAGLWIKTIMLKWEIEDLKDEMFEMLLEIKRLKGGRCEKFKNHKKN